MPSKQKLVQQIKDGLSEAYHEVKAEAEKLDGGIQLGAKRIEQDTAEVFSEVEQKLLQEIDPEKIEEEKLKEGQLIGWRDFGPEGHFVTK